MKRQNSNLKKKKSRDGDGIVTDSCLAHCSPSPLVNVSFSQTERGVVDITESGRCFSTVTASARAHTDACHFAAKRVQL